MVGLAEPTPGAADGHTSASLPTDSSRPSRLPAAFQSLKHRNYRLLWIGTLISSSGDWMDQIALNYLVYQISGSAIDLAVLNLCRLAPIFVFTLLGGVAADRVERRRLMFTTQTVALVLAVILATVTALGYVQIWMVLVIAVGRGIMMSFNQPARQSLISELVPRRDLRNAVALNAATLNLTRVLGPAIGGGLIATVGVSGAFFLNAASFIAVLYGLAQMRFPERVARTRAGMLSELAGGMRYLQAEPGLRSLVLLALLPMVFGMPYVTMLTVFAESVLNVGGGGLGLLTACSGVGAVSGALFVASRAGRLNLERTMFIGLVVFGVALAAFALSPTLWLSVPTLLLVGVGQQVYMATNNTLIQTRVSEEYRGRVLSTLFLNRSMVPLGTVIAGLGTAAFGVQPTVACMAATLVFLALGAARFTPMAQHGQRSPGTGSYAPSAR